MRLLFVNIEVQISTLPNTLMLSSHHPSIRTSRWVTELLRLSSAATRVACEDNTGAVRGTTYMGIMEHITASQASSTASTRYQNMVYKHHARCLDAVSNNRCCDKIVFMRPSSYSGMFTDAHGYDLFSDRFLPCHNYDQLLIRSIQANLVHVKCCRPPNGACKDYLSTFLLSLHCFNTRWRFCCVSGYTLCSVKSSSSLMILAKPLSC